MGSGIINDMSEGSGGIFRARNDFPITGAILICNVGEQNSLIVGVRERAVAGIQLNIKQEDAAILSHSSMAGLLKQVYGSLRAGTLLC